MQAPWALDRTFRSRHECKYLISETLAKEVRRYASSFVQPDFFAARSKDFTYPIYSLYLDNRNFDLYRTTIEGHKNRFKLRIRGYDGNPDSPVFLEVKERSDRIVRKKRCLVSRDVARALLSGRSLPQDASDIHSTDFAFFRSLMARLDAKASVFVHYQREAYEVAGPEPVRITFDRQLQFAPPASTNVFAFPEHSWRPVFCPQVVLELKYTDACPLWVGRLVEHFQLSRVSVAKYIMSVDASREIAPGHSPPSFSSHG